MPELKLFKNTLSHNDRIQTRIDALKADLLACDDDMQHIEDILIVVQNYMSEFIDDDIQHACLKVRESIYFVESFNNY